MFVDLALSKEMETSLKSSRYSDTEWYNVLNALIKAGYKVSVKDDPRGGSVMAIVQMLDQDAKGGDVLWVMRSGTAAGAILKLCYYYEQTDGTLPLPGDRAEDYDNDDDLFR